MKALLVALTSVALCFPAAAQQEASAAPPQQQQAAQAGQEPESGGAQRSVIEVTPGPPAIKNKDLWESTGWIHPFGRMPKYVLQDQKAIWTSPFHTTGADAKYWGIFGAATGALIATDRWTTKQLPNTSDQVRLSTTTSRLGAAYTLIPLSAGFYLIGTGIHNERFRETGMLGFETLINTTIVETVLKATTRRARPLESDGKGHFWDSNGVAWNASFPSGHAINTWALASVVAHQYPHPRIVPIIAYALATTVVAARVGARRHFPGDVVAGAAMGWFIGDYVYGKRHNSELDQKASLPRKILSHIRIGGPAAPMLP
jgi:membrane-associated phospholipid phosphatase